MNLNSGAQLVVAFGTLVLAFLAWLQARIAAGTLRVMEAQEARHTIGTSLEVIDYRGRVDRGRRFILVHVTLANPSDIPNSVVRASLLTTYVRDGRSPTTFIAQASTETVVEPQLFPPCRITAGGAVDGWLCFEESEMLGDARREGYQLVILMSDGRTVEDTLGLLRDFDA